MRDPKRIRKFCNELATIWETNAPDQRFGQLVLNVLGTAEIDPFFPEDDRMIQFFKDFFDPNIPQEHKSDALRRI